MAPVAPAPGIPEGPSGGGRPDEGCDRVEQPGHRPRSRYERAVERGRQRDRRNDRAWIEQYLSEPFGSFLVKQLAWGAVGFALGLLLGSLTWAVVNAVVFTGVGLVGRAWVRRRLREEDRDQPPEA